jgi:hypothetical protein
MIQFIFGVLITLHLMQYASGTGNKLNQHMCHYEYQEIDYLNEQIGILEKRLE